MAGRMSGSLGVQMDLLFSGLRRQREWNQKNQWPKRQPREGSALLHHTAPPVTPGGTSHGIRGSVPSQASTWQMPPNASFFPQPKAPIIYLSRNPGQMPPSGSTGPYYLHKEGCELQSWPHLPVPVAFPSGRLPPTAMEQLYGYPTTQVVPRLQFIPFCPHSQGQRLQLTFQDGTSLSFNTDTTLVPIQLREKGFMADVVSVPPASANHMVLVLRKTEHQSIRASRSTSRPWKIRSPAEDCKTPPAASTSSVPEGLGDPLRDPAQATLEHSLSGSYSQSSSAHPSVSSEEAFSQNIETLHAGSHRNGVQISPLLASHLLPTNQERKDEIELPKNLVTDFPDFEELMSSMESLLPDDIPSFMDPSELSAFWQVEGLLASPPELGGFQGLSQEPQGSRERFTPRPLQERPPGEPHLPAKAKKRKAAPREEEEPRKKVSKTNTSSDPTTAPKTSKGAEEALGTQKGCIAFPGARGRKKESTMAAVEPPKPVPRSHLALQMIESLNILYPLGKGRHLPPPQKKQLPPAASAPAKPFPGKETAPRPLASLPRIPKLSASRPGPQPPSHSVASSMPAVAQRPALNPSVLSQPYEAKDSTSRLYQASGWRPTKASTSREANAPHPPPPPPPAAATSGRSHWRPSIISRTSTVVVRRPVEPPASCEYKGDTFIPWRTPPPDLEVSEPIPEEERPLREMMKRQAQREREEAAQWTSVGRVKYFVEREKEMDLSIAYGYPRRY
ncbi:hypothetical protein JRQ81_013488 [Phrynocephalus forsythii]|uniref:Uncharacterized protein n=1 Tax=Phrynocephalus forsythii TaxID=171643 RepID=A0A9Q0Y099_9SAUR|nr:hypothetical protein JRQ81_013488 [Phrynocephalus forsythii]